MIANGNRRNNKRRVPCEYEGWVIRDALHGAIERGDEAIRDRRIASPVTEQRGPSFRLGGRVKLEIQRSLLADDALAGLAPRNGRNLASIDSA
jgi:hypothetical protein